MDDNIQTDTQIGRQAVVFMVVLRGRSMPPSSLPSVNSPHWCCVPSFPHYPLSQYSCSSLSLFSLVCPYFVDWCPHYSCPYLLNVPFCSLLFPRTHLHSYFSLNLSPSFAVFPMSSLIPLHIPILYFHSLLSTHHPILIFSCPLPSSFQYCLYTLSMLSLSPRAPWLTINIFRPVHMTA